MSDSGAGAGGDVAAASRRARHWLLTGFSGSGKTTVGAVLAALVGRPFLDLDAVVSDRLGRSIGEVFSEMGEVSFRRAEASVLASVGRLDPPAVVALGAGALEGAGVTDAVLSLGVLVWLDVPLETCVRRTGRPGESERPVLAAVRAAGAAAVEAFHAARCAAYGAADVRVEASGAPDEVAREVLRLLVDAGEPLS